MNKSEKERSSQAEISSHLELALDKPGSANSAHMRWSLISSLVIFAITCVIFVYGNIPLAEFPQFTTFHATFVFMSDAVTGVILLGQFRYRRLPSYLILAGAYLFSALVTIPFLLTFPGALMAKGGVIGGTQSSIWVWHFWHILFPSIVILSLFVHMRFADRRIMMRWMVPMTIGMLTSVALLVAAVTVAVTMFHDSLPVLINPQRIPLTSTFYVVGGLAAALTLIALLLSWLLGLKREILHLWLAVVLVAFLGDVIASLGAHSRYTLGWYFGRIEAMIAASILLPVFLGEVNLLYQQIATIMEKLISANRRLVALVKEKNQAEAELRQREEEIRQLAYHDTLTNLPNRRLLIDRLVQTMTASKRSAHYGALMFLDLDNFKPLNDTHGHGIGDLLLIEVARRITCCVRESDTVARFGGDEFVVMLSELDTEKTESAAQANFVAEKIRTALAEPYLLSIQQEGNAEYIVEHQCTSSIGVVLFINHEASQDDVLKWADMAMYQAKAGGRNQIHFYEEQA